MSLVLVESSNVLSKGRNQLLLTSKPPSLLRLRMIYNFKSFLYFPFVLMLLFSNYFRVFKAYVVTCLQLVFNKWKRPSFVISDVSTMLFEPYFKGSSCLSNVTIPTWTRLCKHLFAGSDPGRLWHISSYVLW